MRNLITFKISLTLLWSVVILLGIGQFVVANEISTQGEEITRLESERQILQKEVAALGQEAARLGSLLRVREEAQGLGFTYTSTAFEFVLPPKLAQAQ